MPERKNVLAKYVISPDFHLLISFFFFFSKYWSFADEKISKTDREFLT